MSFNEALFKYELVKYLHEEPPTYTSLSLTRGEAVKLVGEGKLKEVEENLRKTIQQHLKDLPPDFEIPISLRFSPIQTSITITSKDFTSEELEITYYPLDVLLKYIDQTLLKKAQLFKKLPEILSASSLTLVKKKRLLVLRAYKNKTRKALLTTTNKDPTLIEALEYLIDLHRHLKS
ncbi:hypothetical protein Hydth_0534 [Hydrogenobacter thermophilus TK-6]|uniref:Uncharacterized protein n=1 Tax=Hydrogenobacter thermophilus (strain DSM 6534 / IAM 12695 / TK-6) TaxID=608538 RepID=D3DGP7_HYDTT|nr:hypothetical protein [Hydrogenobacter thermophilus]ADO44934.1 hypothetical protein Hydth_0534 [Hydrogenobacter thermophilus TK-6]BAI68999.1 hypothetical protein HTH_0536 [Hydrogenobacter thermophilus TK-6]